jgi:putative MATE family efflux protein
MSSTDPALLTNGNPAKRIIVFAVPIFIGNFLHVFYTMADAFIVGRWLGINALAAVGACYSIIGLVYGFIFGLTDGFTVITAQRVGAHYSARTGEGVSGEDQGIRHSVAAGFILCLLASIIMTAVLLPLCRTILLLMRTPAEILDDASAYVVITLSSLSAVIFSNFLGGIIRAGGNSFSPMLFWVIGTICNIILDIIFVVVCAWGIPAVAAATVISQLISVILITCFLFRRFPQFLPRRKDWYAGWLETGTHLSLGVAMGLQRSIVEVGNILVQAAINGLGAITIAAVTAAQRVRGLNMLPLFAMSGAMTTYTAQNYGAKKMDRVYQGLFQVCLISLGLGVFMAALNQFTGGPIVTLFLKDNPEAIAMAKQFVLITGYTVFILGIMLVFRSSLQGLGNKSAPIICSIMETVMSILAAFVLIPRMGFMGVCLVNPLSWLASGIPLYIAFGVLKKKVLSRMS